MNKGDIEKDIRDAKRISDVIKQLESNFSSVNVKIVHLAEALVLAQEKTRQMSNSYKHTEKLERLLNVGKDKELVAQKAHDVITVQIIDHNKKQLQLDKEKYKLDQENKRERNQNRLEDTQEHGEQVRRSVRLRHMYKQQGEGMSKIMNMMTGMSKSGIFSGLIGTGQGLMTKNAELANLKKSILDLEAQKFNVEKSGGKQSWIDKETKALGKEIKSEKNNRDDIVNNLGMFKGMNPEGQGGRMANLLNPLVEWAKKNKAGIILSAASIGLIFMTFKKLLSVSPMLQKMLELIGLSFNLILRPFGDFIGFILRPLAVALLRVAMPFFTVAYPLLMGLGIKIGDLLAKGNIIGAAGAAAQFVFNQDVLDFITGANRTGNNTGMVGTALLSGTALFVGVLAAGVIQLNKFRKYMNNIINPKQPNANTNASTNTNANTNTNTGNRNPNNLTPQQQKAADALKKQISDAANAAKVQKAADIKAETKRLADMLKTSKSWQNQSGGRFDNKGNPINWRTWQVNPSEGTTWQPKPTFNKLQLTMDSIKKTLSTALQQAKNFKLNKPSGANFKGNILMAALPMFLPMDDFTNWGIQGINDMTGVNDDHNERFSKGYTLAGTGIGERDGAYASKGYTTAFEDNTPTYEEMVRVTKFLNAPKKWMDNGGHQPTVDAMNQMYNPETKTFDLSKYSGLVDDPYADSGNSIVTSQFAPTSYPIPNSMDSGNSTININFNIDKVEKDVDITQITDSVINALELSNTRTS